jgi:hypothetical protein
MVQGTKPDPHPGQRDIPLFADKVPAVFVPDETKICTVKPHILQQMQEWQRS